MTTRIPKSPTGRLSKFYQKSWKHRLAGRKPALVKVTWMDACGGMRPRFEIRDSDWANKAEFGVINTTVGFLLLLDEDWCVTASEICEGGDPRDITEVPTCIVLEVNVLEKATQ